MYPYIYIYPPGDVALSKNQVRSIHGTDQGLDAL